MAGPSCDTITPTFTLPDLCCHANDGPGELMPALRTSTVRKPTG